MSKAAGMVAIAKSWKITQIDIDGSNKRNRNTEPVQSLNLPKK